jgi:DNA-directed RNA polymerase subunit N (RpoN/RPB10)
MGRAFQAVCKSCQHTFPAEEGGGFSFDLVRCDRCGRAAAVQHEDVWDSFLAMLKGLQTMLPEPDGADWRTYPGEPITKDEYHRRVAAKAGACPCGGRFAHDAPLRCPSCGSESVADGGSRRILYD